MFHSIITTSSCRLISVMILSPSVPTVWQLFRNFFAAILYLQPFLHLLTTMLLKIYFFLLVSGAYTFIHPITIYGRYFVDSETKEPVSVMQASITTITTNIQFYIKGVDYQPGGSSGVTSDSDPLSDPVICARDIALFQDLGINVCIKLY